jgi:iron complex outermembrane receptor protein
MKQKNGKNLNHVFQAAALLPTAVFSVGLTVPAQVAHAEIADPTEIVVTARRTEEVIQDIPISMTVFNQDMLNERNITNGSDLVAFTPSLSVNNRFGSDQATFAIRGFTQELRTTASVAVYFADVVAPRGSGNVTAGDGAGPGAFFDLQNVQVLKGPQGTLFGRNTTGGAIQLVPQEPTSKLEGYLEVSRGNYDLNRTQGVLNIPMGDTLRGRVGFDTERRDGYLVNTTGIGADRLGDIDYFAGRVSLIWDPTNDIENYTIYSQSTSDNNGSVQKQFACNPQPTALGGLLGANPCPAALAKQGNGFYNVSSTEPNPESKLRQWQLINTTTWDISDKLSVKNLLSYASLWQTTRGSIFGDNWYLSSLPSREFLYTMAGTYPGTPTNDQGTFVEEIRASGTALDEKLTWQGGYYYEDSRPNGWSGAQSISALACQTPLSSDPATWDCINSQPFLGAVSRTFYKSYFNNQAVYGQGTYDINDEWRATLGLRYTVDKTRLNSEKTAYSGGTASTDPDLQTASVAGGPALVFPATAITCQDSGLPANGSNCLNRLNTKSEAPTWLIDVDYRPTADILTYAKYSRGYRQGSIVGAAPLGYQIYDPEKVDAYEIGAKTSFRGPVPGTFNIDVFYNELKDQQLQYGLLPLTPTKGTNTTAILNAGSSTIQGVEAETTLKLMEDLTFNLAYTYLETNLDSADFPGQFDIAGWAGSPAAVEGEHLTFSPRHTVITGLSYRFPLPVEVGDVTAGATYTFTSSQNSSSAKYPENPSASQLAELGARQIVNLNLGWKEIFGSPFDASFFMTNALNEKYYSYVSGLYNNIGAEYGVPGEPKMWGARVKYNFK